MAGYTAVPIEPIGIGCQDAIVIVVIMARLTDSVGVGLRTIWIM
jgi:hypothetical protein